MGWDRRILSFLGESWLLWSWSIDSGGRGPDGPGADVCYAGTSFDSLVSRCAEPEPTCPRGPVQIDGPGARPAGPGPPAGGGQGGAARPVGGSAQRGRAPALWAVPPARR